MESPAFVDIGTLIASKPRVNGGKPCVSGTGTSVQGIAALYNRALTPAQIHAELPHLELAQIYGALAFYLANKPAIDRATENDRKLGEKLAREQAKAERLAAAPAR